MGTTGLDTWTGYIYKAYHQDLYWPGAYEEFNRIRRMDQEISIVRQVYDALAHQISFEWEMPDEPTPKDEEVNEFLNTLLGDVEGGQRQFISTVMSHTPFMGWIWFEAVPAVRSLDWRSPDGDDWESQYDDGRIGFRRLGFRDHGSFEQWILDEGTGRLLGMVQHDPPNDPVDLKIDRAVHLTYGDADNPEGLSPLEAIWRMEKIKYGLEVIFGIGAEHTAGYAKVTTFEELDATGKGVVRQAMRALMTAQEGNYITEIDGKFMVDIMDVPFAAAGHILEAVRYYSMSKLQIYTMAWIAMATTAGTGALAAIKDSSTMFLTVWNSMTNGFAEQTGEHLWKQAKRYNSDLFTGAAKQKLTATPIEKEIALAEIAQLLPVLQQVLDLGEEDILAIRRLLAQANIVSETLPEVEEVVEPVDGDEVDEDGLPVAQPRTSGGDEATPENLDSTQGLNGAQIRAAIEIMDSVRAGSTTVIAAIELFTALGISPDRARTLSEEAKKGQRRLRQQDEV
jgi:hypothetical protein